MKTLFVQPLVTEKSMALSNDGVYQFVVPTWATKRQIAQAVTAHFGVTVEDVKTATMHGKLMTFKRVPGQQAQFKKASVHLKKGESIADFSLPVEEKAGSPEMEPQAPVGKKAKAEKEAPTKSQITVRSKSKKNEAQPKKEEA